MPWQFIDKLSENTQTAQQHDGFHTHLAKNAIKWQALVHHDTCKTENKRNTDRTCYKKELATSRDKNSTKHTCDLESFETLCTEVAYRSCQNRNHVHADQCRLPPNASQGFYSYPSSRQEPQAVRVFVVICRERTHHETLITDRVYGSLRKILSICRVFMLRRRNRK